MTESNLIPIAQYAEKIGRNPATVRQKCLRGTFPGAVKIGRDWLVPSDANYPDNRITTGKFVNWRSTKMSKRGWHILFTFAGKLDRQELNQAIANETCDDTPWFEDDENFNRAVKDGWITFTDGKTTVWEDGVTD